MKTNNEIVKGLECCSVHPMKCKECPYQGNECCTNAHRKDALNLIKHLMTEIERLEDDVKAQDDSIQSLLSIVNSNYQNGRIDASKEFAERLKSKAVQKYDWNEYVEIEDIDNLAEEMEKGK